MNKIKASALVLLLLTGSGVMFGSSGFTGVSADRSVSVEVANDNHAFVGYQSADRTVQDNTTIALVTVENRFSNSVDVSNVTIKKGGSIIRNLRIPTDIPSGDSDTVQATVYCTSNTTQEIELTVTVTRGSVTAQLSGDTETRDFNITCTDSK